VNKVAEYMRSNTPPTHTAKDDCPCRDCFWRVDRSRYWTASVVETERENALCSG
jgi:hypothetical protein